MSVKRTAWKRAGNALFLILIFSLTVWAVLRGEDLTQLARSLAVADVKWLIPAVGCVVLFIISESAAILYLLRTLGTKAGFGHCCLYSFIGFFYSCITPSASGGQPMQVVAMRKDNIPAAVSSVVLAIVTITYKLVLVIIGAAVVLLRPADVIHHLESVEELVYLGLALNIGCIVLLMMLVFRPAVMRTCLQAALRWGSRVRMVRHPEKMQARMERAISQYTGAAEYYRSHHIVIFNVLVLSFVQRAFLFLVTWLVYKALGLSGDSLLTIITLQAMISVVVDMLPLPGGMGASENLFMQIFLPIFGSAMVLPGMLISRGVSYYTQLLLSAVITGVSAFVLRKHKG